VEQDAVMHGMGEDEATVAGEIDVADLDIGVVPGEIVMPGERAADLAIAALVMDGIDQQRVRALGVDHFEQTELPDEMWAQILQDEALVAVISPGVAQRAIGIAIPGEVGEPLAVFVLGLEADALDVAHHGEAEGVGVDAVVAAIVEIGLRDDAGMRMKRLEEGAVADQPLLVQAVHDLIVDEGGAALVHEARLLLRIEILRDGARDAHELALERLEPRRALLQEVKQVLFRQAELAAHLRTLLLLDLDILFAFLADIGRPPDVVVILLEMAAAIF